MNHTSRMVVLLGELRREMNGVVSDTMSFRGKAYGLNYGVSLYTIRATARAESPDHEFARYLYLQDVRELRLAALHIAQPERLAPDEFAFWGAGVINSEIAAEMAFALLCRAEALPQLFHAWTTVDEPLLAYAALLAASRAPKLRPEWLPAAGDLVRRSSEEPLTAQGVVALFAAYGVQNAESRRAVLRIADSLGATPSADFIHEELAWRLAHSAPVNI